MKEYSIKFHDNRLVDTDGLNVEQISDHSYRISIADGRYNVRVLDGDLNDRGDVNVYTTLNHVRQNPIWAGDKVIRSGCYKTEVKNGCMEISFSGKYVCIQGIDIAAEIEDEIESLSAGVHASEEKSSVRLFIRRNTQYEKVHLYRKKCGSGMDPEMIELCGEEYVDEDVLLCESYEYYACIVDNLGFEGKISDKITVEIADKTAAKPEIKNYTVKTVNEHTTKLTWEGKAWKYRIYRKTAVSNYKFLGETENCSFTDETMITDRSYIYAVQALSTGGKSRRKEAESQIFAPLRRRQMEQLDRGAVAIRTRRGMYLTFRLAAWEYETAEFHIYADGKRIAQIGKHDATNYLDKKGDLHTRYEIKKVTNGKEEEHGYIAKNLAHNYFDLPINKPADYKAPDGAIYSYTANDASVADLDGDGEYELILKWDCAGRDNSHAGYSGPVFLDAYKLDGRMLWRIDLGRNIRAGAHYTQFMVYDFDGDGYAEMIVKTADGTRDAAGNYVGDKTKDYRNREGFIIEGPEYLSLFDGRYGTLLDTIPYDPPRGNIADWGDSWGNRVDRFLACVAYLDGIHPSAVMCRGYYDHGRPAHLAAWDVKDKKLVKRWKFEANHKQNIEYTNQGFHNLAVADVDDDGCDEIIYGACVIDHDGTGLYSTDLGHGDAMHVGKFTKDSPGFDYFGIHEDADCPWGIEAHDAGTGKHRFGIRTGKDTARGLTAKIDPRYDGNQMWAYYGGGLYNYADGKKITDTFPEQVNFAIWWDGDLLRELLDHDWYGYETGVGIPKIYKWNWRTEETEILLSTDQVLSNNGTKGNPCIQACLFGDWREEAVFRGKNSEFLRIYTTTEPTKCRIYTLMHDAVYRMGIAWQNTAYNQPPQTGFYIGPDMKGIKVPPQDYISPAKMGE
ncbi:lipolytic protein G-D-S-L family [Roseburia sp. CAG:303]|nr:lipolytic protein G-D-S-L family [Roseburia sp. CAG:303]